MVPSFERRKQLCFQVIILACQIYCINANPPVLEEGRVWCKKTVLQSLWETKDCIDGEFCSQRGRCNANNVWEYEATGADTENFQVINCQSEYCDMAHTCRKPGFYCLEGGHAQSDVRALLCKPGHYCPEGEHRLRPCKAGHYCPTGAGTQHRCPQDHFCEKNSEYPTPCMENICEEGELFIPCNSKRDGSCYKLDSITEGGKTFLAIFLLPVVALVILGFSFSVNHLSKVFEDGVGLVIFLSFLILFAIPSWVFSTFVPYAGGNWVEKMEDAIVLIVICIVSICMGVSLLVALRIILKGETDESKKEVAFQWGCTGTVTSVVITGFILGWCMVMGLLADCAYALYETENGESSKGILPIFNTVFIVTIVIVFAEVVIPIRTFPDCFGCDIWGDTWLSPEFRGKYLLLFLGYVDFSSDVAFMATINNNDIYYRFHIVLMLLSLSLGTSVYISFYYNEPLWLLIASALNAKKVEEHTRIANKYNKRSLLIFEGIPMFILQVWIMSDSSSSAAWQDTMISITSLLCTVADVGYKHRNTMLLFVEFMQENDEVNPFKKFEDWENYKHDAEAAHHYASSNSSTT